MKKLFTTALALMIVAIGTGSAKADDGLTRANLALLMNSVSADHARDLINWQVGDSMDYDLKMGPMGGGTMHKFVKSEDKSQGAIWIRQEIAVMGQNQTVEMLMRRSDAKILKVIQNGQETQIPDEQVEVVSTNYESVTVPAGTFQSMHVVANTKDVKNLQMWANPDQTCMDGTLKQIVPTSFVTMTTELKSFHKTN